MVLPEMDGFLNQFVHETHVFFNICFGERKRKGKCDGGSPENKSAHTGPSVCNKNLGSKRGFKLRESSSFQQIVSFPTTFTASRCLRGEGKKVFFPNVDLLTSFIFLRLFIFMRQDRKQNKYSIPSAVTLASNSSALQLFRRLAPPRSPEPSIRVSVWTDDIRRALPKNPFFVVPFSYSFFFESLIRRRFFCCCFFLLLFLFLSWHPVYLKKKGSDLIEISPSNREWTDISNRREPILCIHLQLRNAAAVDRINITLLKAETLRIPIYKEVLQSDLYVLSPQLERETNKKDGIQLDRIKCVDNPIWLSAACIFHFSFICLLQT